MNKEGEEPFQQEDNDEVFKDWEDGKWIDSEFLKKLKETRSLDSALAVNKFPILTFARTADHKIIEQYNLYTFLTPGTQSCRATIKHFIGGTSEDVYVGVLNSENNSCGADQVAGEKISGSARFNTVRSIA